MRAAWCQRCRSPAVSRPPGAVENRWISPGRWQLDGQLSLSRDSKLFLVYSRRARFSRRRRCSDEPLLQRLPIRLPISTNVAAAGGLYRPPSVVSNDEQSLTWTIWFLSPVLGTLLAEQSTFLRVRAPGDRPESHAGTAPSSGSFAVTAKWMDEDRRLRLGWSRCPGGDVIVATGSSAGSIATSLTLWRRSTHRPRR